MSASEAALRVIHCLIAHFEFVEKPKDSQWNKLKETDQVQCIIVEECFSFFVVRMCRVLLRRSGCHRGSRKNVRFGGQFALHSYPCYGKIAI